MSIILTIIILTVIIPEIIEAILDTTRRPARTPITIPISFILGIITLYIKATVFLNASLCKNLARAKYAAINKPVFNAVIPFPLRLLPKSSNLFCNP